MVDRDDRIRELAYLLWLEEGYPEGEAERHWLTAEILVESGRLEPKRIEGGELGDDSGTPGVQGAGAPAPALASTRQALRSSGRRLTLKTPADHEN